MKITNLFNKERKILTLIFVLALSLRIYAVINLPERFKVPDSDPRQYDTLATNLLVGKGYVIEYYNQGLPTSHRAPLYPIFLALIYFIFGHDYFAVRIIQSILGALLCVVLYFIAKAIYSRKVAFLSAVLLAFYQPFIYYSFYGGPAFLFAENLFIFLLATAVLFMIKNLFIVFSNKNAFLAGLLIGLAVLARPVLGLLPFCLTILFLFENKYPNKKVFNRTVFLFIGFILIMLPWVARNYVVHKAFVPFTTEGGAALLAGNNEYASGDGLCNLSALFSDKENENMRNMSEIDVEHAYRNRAFKFIAGNYKKLPKLFFKKLLVFWDLYNTDYDEFGQSHRRYNMWYSVIFMFSIFGIFKSILSKQNRGVYLMFSLFAYFSAIAMIFLGEPRFRNPIEPYLIIFASSGIISIYDTFKNKITAFSIISVVIGINLLAYIYADAVLDWVKESFKCIIKM